MRGNGIGKKLFLEAKQWAKQRGAKKLYISAHSSVESQAFYKAMGCVEAKVYNQKHITMIPTILGSGIKLFDKSDLEIKLKLIKTQSYNGMVDLVYSKR